MQFAFSPSLSLSSPRQHGSGVLDGKEKIALTIHAPLPSDEQQIGEHTAVGMQKASAS